jgi:hypothetical protein
MAPKSLGRRLGGVSDGKYFSTTKKGACSLALKTLITSRATANARARIRVDAPAGYDPTRSECCTDGHPPCRVRIPGIPTAAISPASPPVASVIGLSAVVLLKGLVQVAVARSNPRTSLALGFARVFRQGGAPAALRLSTASPHQSRVMQLRVGERSVPPGRALTLCRLRGAGEIHELKEELHSLDKHKQMDAVKKGAPPCSNGRPTGSQNRRLVGVRLP